MKDDIIQMRDATDNGLQFVWTVGIIVGFGIIILAGLIIMEMI